MVRGDKTPLVKWEKYQTVVATEEEIRKWWGQWPDANIGVATGEVSGIVVVDVEAGSSIADLSPTVTARTGGGGFHLFYKHPGVRIKNSVRELAPLTDVRGDGGYVVVAPSLHKSGGCYAWSVAPADVGFEDLPKWILEKCAESSKVKKDWREFPTSPVLEGARNDTAASYTGKLLHDLSPELWASAGWAGLKEWNETCARPPLPEKELRQVFQSIAQKQVASGSKRFSERRAMGVNGRALITCFANIQPEAISWLWADRIALGKLTIIAGDPGLGKSLLTAAFAAHVSMGYPWPIDGSVPPIGDVVLLSAEDDPADTIRPRLDAAVADCSRVHALKAIQDVDGDGTPIQRSFSFKRDITVLAELLKSLPECKLLVIDPVSAYLDGADSHNNTDVRGLLAPLAELAARHKIAVVLIQHLNRSAGGNAMYRPMGSIAFVAAARATYIVTKDKDNPLRRLFMSSKNNLAKDSTGLAYSVVTAENGAPVVNWEQEPVEITADEALAQPESSGERTDTDWAINFLQDCLASGPKQASEINKEARVAGVKDKPLRRAREKLGIKPRKSAFSGGWEWALPEHEDAQDSEDVLSKTEGTLADTGHLGANQS